MTADLVRTVAEDPAFAETVAQLRGAPESRVPADFTARVLAAIGEEETRRARLAWRARAARLLPRLAVAAGAAAILAFGAVVGRRPGAADLVACQRADGTFSASSAAPYVQAYAVTVLASDPSADRAALASAVDALVKTQNAAGGWSNAGLSARNTAALSAAARAGVASAVAAYRRGARYLRACGIREPTASDLAGEARRAAALLAVPCADAGISRSIDLAARL